MQAGSGDSLAPTWAPVRFLAARRRHWTPPALVLLRCSFFQVLLVTSSFMSPSESRSGANPNRVRIFGPDKLVRAAAEKRWDRVKIVCSQPYSKVPGVGAEGTGSSVLGKERGEEPILSPRGLSWEDWAAVPLGDQENAGSRRSLKWVCLPSRSGGFIPWRMAGKGRLQDLRGVGEGGC